MNNIAALEGLLFVVGDEGLTLEQITEILELTSKEAKELVKELKEKYENKTSGIRINFLGSTFKLTTKDEHREIYEKLIENPHTNVLSQSALETLAIIAYNEPITRSSIDDIRGVGSGQMVRKLVAKGFIKESGRAETPGRPIIYEITHDFLDYFGLANKEELPVLKQISIDDISDEETNLFESKYKEVFDVNNTDELILNS